MWNKNVFVSRCCFVRRKWKAGWANFKYYVCKYLIVCEIQANHQSKISYIKRRYPSKVSLTCESMLELATAIRIRVIHCMHTIFAPCLRLKSYHFPLFSTSLFSFPINFIPMVFYVTPQVEIWSPLLHSQQYKAFRNIITTSELLEKEK